MIEILRVNQLEHKDKKIYEDSMTVYEVAREVFDAALNSDTLSKRHSDMLKTLYWTKDLNSPYFFSISFTIGVYLPLLAPLIFPPLITLFKYLKLKKFGKNKKNGNEAKLKKD